MGQFWHPKGTLGATMAHKCLKNVILEAPLGPKRCPKTSKVDIRTDLGALLGAPTLKNIKNTTVFIGFHYAAFSLPEPLR